MSHTRSLSVGAPVGLKQTPMKHDFYGSGPSNNQESRSETDPRAAYPQYRRPQQGGGPEMEPCSKAPHHRFVEAIRCSKRRLIQRVLVKLKQAQASDDSEYQARRAQQTELLREVTALMTHMKSFVTNVVALGYGCSAIGSAWSSIATGEASSNQESTSTACIDPEFEKNMRGLDAAAREMTGVILTSLLPSLQKKLGLMVVLKLEMDEREKLKLDYDSALRKLRLAKERGKPQDVVRRDMKLQAARAKLEAATDSISEKCSHYESTRSTFVYRELRQFREFQAKFFSACAAGFQPPHLGPLAQ